MAHLIEGPDRPAPWRAVTAGGVGLLGVVVLVILLLVMAPMAGPAQGHSALRSTVPPADTTTTGPVRGLEMEFAQPIAVPPDSVQVTGPGGADWSADPPVLTGDTSVRVALPTPLVDGAYTVRWRVIGEDGHPIEGSYAIIVAAGPPPHPMASAPSTGTGTSPARDVDDLQAGAGSPSGGGGAQGGGSMAGGAARSGSSQTPRGSGDHVAGGPPVAERGGVPGATDAAGHPGRRGSGAPAPSRTAPEVVEVLSRWLAFLGILVAIGVAAFGILVTSDSSGDQPVLSRLVVGAAGLAAGASVVQLLMHVAVVSGQGLPGVGAGPAWAVVLGTGMFTAAALRVAAGALLAMTVVTAADWSSRRAHSAPVAIAAAILLLSFQFTGHTASSQPSTLVRIADGVHVAAAALWTGGVLALAAVLRARRRRGRGDSLLVARFSVAVTGSVVLVGLAGVTLALVELTGVADLLTTAYGQVLLAKVAVVGVIAGLGALNHLRLVPAVVAGRDGASARLRQVMGVELALFPVAIALTAVLVRLSP